MRPRWPLAIARSAGAHMGSLVLVAVGIAMLVAALYQRKGRDEFAIVLAVLGAGLVFYGCSLPRVRDVELTPGKVKASLHDVRETTTRYATEDPEAIRADVAQMPEPQFVSVARGALGSLILEDLLGEPEGPLADCLLHLYLYDDDTGRLRAVEFAGSEEEAEAWEVGTGATGTAWAEQTYVLATGDAVWDATHGLTPEQQARFRHLAAVAAMPVINARGDTLAVLTCSTTNPKSGLTTDEGFDSHLLLAMLVARVLVDVLKWFPDEET